MLSMWYKILVLNPTSCFKPKFKMASSLTKSFVQLLKLGAEILVIVHDHN